MNERRAVGHRIRSLRERLGWGREELARRVGVHAGSIARWETGGAVPHACTLERIAELGGTTGEWLRTGSAAPAPGATAAEAESGRETPDPFGSPDAMARFLGEIAPAGDERLRKPDALEGLRRMLTARGLLRSPRLKSGGYNGTKSACATPPRTAGQPSVRDARVVAGAGGRGAPPGRLRVGEAFRSSSGAG